MDGSSNQAKAASSSTGLTVADEYSADFSSSTSRGIGLRYINKATDLYVDLRLHGYEGKDPTISGKKASFSAPGMKVNYETGVESVKETIVLEKRSPSTLRFNFSAPGLKASMENDQIVFSPPGETWMFRLGKLEAKDALDIPIPGTMQIEGSTVVIRLDQAALANATLPVTIDPTIEGVPSGATSGTYGKRLFRTSDGRFIFFYRELPTSGPRLVYRTSADQGKTWTPVVVIGPAGSSADLSVASLPDDGFAISYSSGTVDLPKVSFRRLTRSGTSWDIGADSQVTNVAVYLYPLPSVVALDVGPLGQRFAVGYAQFNKVFNRFEYGTSLSQDSGTTWLPAPACSTQTGAGMLVAQGSRLICITAHPGGVDARIYNGTTWGTPVVVFDCCINDIPSAATTKDGRLHLVTSRASSVRYSSLAPGASTWQPQKTLGSGKLPVITTDGTALFVHAEYRLSNKESQINSFVATDGINFNAGKPLGGKAFDYVLDYNEKFDFQDLAGDALFGLVATGTVVGNRIGSSSIFHRLDSPTKKLSFGFTASAAETVTGIKLWATANVVNTLRVGIQSDSGSAPGMPSGNWLQGTGTGGLQVNSFTNMTTVASPIDPIPLTTASLPVTQLYENVRYHLVVEPDAAQSTTKWAAIQAVGTDAGLQTHQDVLDYGVTSTAWVVAAAEVPRFALSGPSAEIIESQLIALATSYAVRDYQGLDYQGVGESFLATSTAISPTNLRMHLTKVGNPHTIKIRMIEDQTNTEIWSTEYTPPSSGGWVSVPITGLTLTPGARYRYTVEALTYSAADHWLMSTSGDMAVSWDGILSTATRYLDRPGFADKTARSADSAWGTPDFWAFNTDDNDALYLGNSEPFDFAVLTRLSADVGVKPDATWSYYNGVADTALVMTRNELTKTSGEASFNMPDDWAMSTVDGKNAYWVKVKAAYPSIASILVDRLTSIRNLSAPTATPIFDDPVQGSPIAYADLNLPPKVAFTLYDAVGPAGTPEVRPNPFDLGVGGVTQTHIGFFFPEHVSYTLSIKRASTDEVVRTVSGSGTGVSFYWDGKDSSGGTVGNATYKAVVSAVDDQGNQQTDGVWVTKGPGPLITSTSKTKVQIGELFTVTGTGFDTGLGVYGVNFEGGSLEVSSWSPTQIVARFPAGTQTGSHSINVLEADTTSPPFLIDVANYIVPTLGQEILAGIMTFKVTASADAFAIASSHGVPTSSVSAMFAGTSDTDLSRWYVAQVNPTTEASLVTAFAADSQVVWAEVETPAFPAATIPNDKAYTDGKQWGLDDLSGTTDNDIDAARAWDVSTGVTSTTIAVIDSGISPHWDLVSNLVAGRNYTTSTSTDDGCIGTDIGSHGTEVAGISSAATNNGNVNQPDSMAGVSWIGKVRPYKVLSNIGGHCRWATATPTTTLANVIYQAAVDGSDVINMSLTQSMYSGSEQDVITGAWNLGRSLVAPSGNDGAAVTSFPAAFKHAIAVGAINRAGNIISSSNKVDKGKGVYAPGADIYTTQATSSGYGFAQVTGTSFASAFVAGVASLIRSKGQDNVYTFHAIVDIAIQRKTDGPQLLWADGSLILFRNVTIPDGVFVRNQSSWYFLDRGKKRLIADANILHSWGIYDQLNDNSRRTNVVYVNDERLPLAKGDLLGFRPGVLLKSDVTTDTNVYVVSNDINPNPGLDTSEFGRWTRGDLKSLDPARLACLGYKIDRAITVPVALLTALYSTPTVYNSCDNHPNGSILANTTPAVGKTFWMRDLGTLRTVAGTNETASLEGQVNGQSTRNAGVFTSWGMGDFDDPLANDAIIPNSSADLEIQRLQPSQLVTEGRTWLGYRSGTTVKLTYKDGSQELFVITLPNANGIAPDFGAANRRVLDSYRTLTCYGFSWLAIQARGDWNTVNGIHHVQVNVETYKNQKAINIPNVFLPCP